MIVWVCEDGIYFHRASTCEFWLPGDRRFRVLRLIAEWLGLEECPACFPSLYRGELGERIRFAVVLTRLRSNSCQVVDWKVCQTFKVRWAECVVE